nr:anucleate primary sterigmata protein a [Quercus suber]
MATSANLSLGTMPANTTTDPFTATSGHVPSAALRYATFDADQSLLYATSSPSQAKRALEAHLKDTDRRIQDASRLGTTLVQQRKELFARLKDVEQVQADDEVPEDLQRRLAELEREYNEIGKESARAFLPKSRVTSDGTTSTVLTSNGRESPTKLSVSSRKQRNQPSNRVHDIEFATEISTSLLAQVRQLQAALSEKDDALKETTAAKAHLEAEALGMAQKIRHLDDNEQKFKDENWNLEMKLQEMEAGMKTTADKHNRLSQALMTTEGEKSAAQRDLDELKAFHDKLNEDHAMTKRQQETDLHGLRRDVVIHQSERQIMQKKIEELTAQNTELAKAVSSRWSHQSAASESEFVSADEERADDSYSPDHSESASPIKGTPRHGMLETETLKSSLKSRTSHDTKSEEQHPSRENGEDRVEAHATGCS